MEDCPNCGTQVDATATACPTCGLPRNLPLYDASGTVIGTTFGPATSAARSPSTSEPSPSTRTTPAPAAAAGSPASGSTAAATSAATPGSVPPQSHLTVGPATSGRGRTVLVVVGALAAAMVLGVVVAVVVNAVVLAPSRRPSESNPPTAAGQTTQPGATPIDQAALLSKVGGSVVTVVASTCSAADWSGNATGFLVNPTTVVTAWTGVAEAVSVAVLDPAGHPIPARISLADKALGVAVVEASRPIDGRTALQPAGGTLATGQRWYGLHLDTLRSKAPVLVPVGIGERGQGSLGGAVLQQALVTDVAAGDFAAGGPLVNGDGQVVGLMARYPDSDVLLAVGVDRLQQVLSSGSAPGTATCDLPLGPQGPFAPLSGSHDVLRQYFAAINAGDYATAWTLLPEKTRGKLETAAKGWNSTYDFNVAITDLGGGKVRAEFDSIFAAGKGPEPTLTCARWGIVYTIVDGLIANAKADRGAKGYEAC